VGLLDVLRFQETGVRVAEERRTEGSADVVAGDVAEECGDGQDHAGQPERDVDRPGRDEQADGEQQ
jgi:hypothetical protein